MLTLDPDVAAKARQGARKLGRPFKEVINAALRIGLDRNAGVSFRSPQLVKNKIARDLKQPGRELGARNVAPGAFPNG